MPDRDADQRGGHRGAGGGAGGRDRQLSCQHGKLVVADLLRDALAVEDIIDTGHTLAHVLAILATRNPARLEVCALLSKPSRREIPVPTRWLGFEIADDFVAGYGIDYAQRNRNLPHIGAVRLAKRAINESFS